MPQSPLTLDAYRITQWQSCRRRYVLERDWRVTRAHPKSLFDRLLRAGLVRLESGADSAALASSLRTEFMEVAADPGLDWPLSGSPFTFAQEWCAMLENVLRACGRLSLLTTEAIPGIPLSDSLSWRPLARRDESGTLHRWITVDTLDQDRLASELHSWYVFGDIAACDAPMTLHVIEIGRIARGRRQSPWVRAYQHPMASLSSKYKFQRTGGRALKGDWKPLWIYEHPEIRPEDWVAQMERDGLLDADNKLIHHLQVAEVAPAHRSQFRDQLAAEARQIQELLGPTSDTTPPDSPVPAQDSSTLSHSDESSQLVQLSALRQTNPASVPMSRPACDGWRPCPWQGWCYGPVDTPIASVGLYQRRTVKAPAASTSVLTVLAGG